MFASIDIGTHSVLLLIGEVLEDGSVRMVEDRIAVTGLGEGLGHGEIISGEATDRTIHALHAYLGFCRKHHVEEIKAVGTAALRKARNASDFLKTAKKKLGLEIEVISAEKEARLTYEASAHDFGKEILVIDVGGGSTELISGPPPLSLVSLPMGSVTLTEEFIRSDPVSTSDEKSLRGRIDTCLHDDLNMPPLSIQTMVATAGTATTLMAMHFELECYDGRLVHGQHLNGEDLERLLDSIGTRTVEQRKLMPGLMPERAEVIFAGTVLLQEIMMFFNCDVVTISDRGVRWGVFYEEFCGNT